MNPLEELVKQYVFVTLSGKLTLAVYTTLRKILTYLYPPSPIALAQMKDISFALAIIDRDPLGLSDEDFGQTNCSTPL